MHILTSQFEELWMREDEDETVESFNRNTTSYS